MGTYDTIGGTPRHDPNFDRDDSCVVCGKDPSSNCECPECPRCNTVGDPTCAINGGDGCMKSKHLSDKSNKKVNTFTKERNNRKVVSKFREERDRPKSDPSGINWLICGFCDKKHLHVFPYIKSGGRHRERQGDAFCLYCRKIVKCYHHGKHIGEIRRRWKT